MMKDRFKLTSALSMRTADVVDRAQVWLFLQKHSLYGLAATRILVGVAVLGLLLSNFNSRHVLWGAASGWSAPFRENSAFELVIGLYSSNPVVFTVQYLILLGSAVALIIGWRTRIVTFVLALGLPALVERADVVGDQSDNITRIGLTLMLFMTTNAYWSLDRRRRESAPKISHKGFMRRLWYGHAVLPDWFSSLIHNAALIALACQIFILYTASALYKVQGELWQAGTAVYYPLSLPEYSVIPWINEMVIQNGTILTVVTYFAVYVQLFFAVGLLHPTTRRIALIGVLLMHGGIALLMALPWFSIAMLAFDAIFVSSRTWKYLENRILRFIEAARHKLSNSRSQQSDDNTANTSVSNKRSIEREPSAQEGVPVASD